MQEERLLLSGADRDRLKVLHEVAQGHLTQSQGAGQLEISDRWVREMVDRLRREGDKAVIHGLRGKPSPRRIAERIERRAVALVAREYPDFGPTLAAEYLGRDYGIEVSRETLRQWLMRAGVWKGKRERKQQIHVWRKRRSCFGELVQWDTSEHDWLEGRGECRYLIAMIDDATSQALAWFAPHDSTAENMRLLWHWLETHGRFLDAYTDRAGLFVTSRPNQRDEERDGKLTETQIGRALRELGMGWIAARSPQAKGRIERFFGTAQNRLVKGLRKKKVKTREEANRYLAEEYLPLWNERFSVRAANETDAHRALGTAYDLPSILSRVETRTVGQDYTIRYDGRIYQLAGEQVKPALRGGRVRVEERLDGCMVARGPERDFDISVCEGATRKVLPKTAVKPVRQRSGSPNRNWMKGFDLHSGPPLKAVIASAYGDRREDGR